MMRFLRSIWRLFLVILAAIAGAILGLIGYAALASPFTLNGLAISMGVGAVLLGALTALFPKPMELILDIAGFG